MIPWLAGNEKVSYKRRNVDTVDDYIIKEVSGSVSA
jgi:hypothetical protein